MCKFFNSLAALVGVFAYLPHDERVWRLGVLRAKVLFCSLVLFLVG